MGCGLLSRRSFPSRQLGAFLRIAFQQLCACVASCYHIVLACSTQRTHVSSSVPADSVLFCEEPCLQSWSSHLLRPVHASALVVNLLGSFLRSLGK